MTISILGCGWYGQALSKKLLEERVIVKGSVTNSEKLEILTSIGVIPYIIDIEPGQQTITKGFFRCDILVISISPKFRQGQSGIYLEKIKSIIRLIEINQLLKIIYISSTGVYGDSNASFNESDEPEPGNEQGKILLAAENLFKNNSRFKTTIIRFGGLLGLGRNAGRFFAGKTDVPNGLAPVNLIHLDDCIGITIAVIRQDYFGIIFNAVMPYHPVRAKFYSLASGQAGLQEPLFIPELKCWKIVDGVNPVQLLNYEFKYPDPEMIDFRADCNT